MFLKGFFVCLTYFTAASSAFDASFIKPCRPTDNECMVNSARDAVEHVVYGISELGIPSLDPIAIDSLRSDGPNLKFGLRNIQIAGVSKCNITEITRNTVNNTIKLTAEGPLIGFGQYDLHGKILFLEVVGDGDYEIKCNKFKFTVEARIKDIYKNGHKYWKVTGFSYNYEILDKVHFRFDNLFGGDNERAKPILEALEHSSMEIIEEVGGPIITKSIGIYVDAMKKLLRAVPADQLEIV